MLSPRRADHVAWRSAPGQPSPPAWPAATCPGRRCRTARQRRRAALLCRIADQPLADEFLDVARRAARCPFTPPGAEKLAHHQLGIQRAADRQQLPGSPEHLGEQRVRWGSTGEHRAGPLPSTWVARPAGGSRRRLCGLTWTAFQILAAPCHVRAGWWPCFRVWQILRASGTAGAGHSGHQVSHDQCNSRGPPPGYGVPGGRAGRAATSFRNKEVSMMPAARHDFA